MDVVKLKFINKSNDRNNSQIVLFQKNTAPTYDELHVAWKVIENCGQGDNHPFEYPMAMSISAADSYGNFMPEQPVTPGQQFQVIRDNSGDVLTYAGDATSPIEVQVANNLGKGGIVANVYKAGRLLAQKRGIAPQQMAVFQFKPTLWIGAVSDVEEGAVMNSAVMSKTNTELSLMGIASAEIWMTGGGADRNATPIVFSLQNVVRA